MCVGGRNKRDVREVLRKKRKEESQKKVSIAYFDKKQFHFNLYIYIFFKAHLIVKSKTKQTNREIKTNQEEGYHILLTDE